MNDTDTGDTEVAFIEATYCALCEHGYADLTMQDIADETDKSKAALHYYFDGKEDLLLRFLDHMNEEFLGSLDDPAGSTPAERLVSLLETILSTSGDGDQQFTTAFMEIKAQAPYRGGYRERLEYLDDEVYDRVHALVSAGVDSGQFAPETDPGDVTEHVLTYVQGTWTRSAAVGADVDALRGRLIRYVDSLLAPDAAVSFDGRTTDATDDDPDDSDDGTDAGVAA